MQIKSLAAAGLMAAIAFAGAVPAYAQVGAHLYGAGQEGSRPGPFEKGHAIPVKFHVQP